MRRHLIFLLVLSGCLTSTAPRFSQDVATTFAHDDMYRLVTADAEVYYPREHRAAAERLAARATECLRTFRENQVTQRPRARALLFLTSANFNNAYVTGQLQGEPLHSVNPLSFTNEFFQLANFPAADPGDISCHEMFHYAHFEQIEGLWRLVNAVVGDVAPSQVFLERWFTEGMAQYYEGRIRKHLARPNSPLYRAQWDSFVAMREGHVGPADLQPNQRELYPMTGAYLASLPFVEYLAEKYGEEKLWEVMEVQGRTIFTPFGVVLRFKSVYGKSLGALIDEWSEHLVKLHVARPRPPGQEVLRDGVGYAARLAADPRTGRWVLFSTGLEEGPRLRTFASDGTLLGEKKLVLLGTDRDWVYSDPFSFSGLSFTADGRLFVMHDELVDRGDSRAQIWEIDVDSAEVKKVWNTGAYGLGGAVRPDGSAYTFVDTPPGAARIVDFDLATREQRTLVELPPTTTVASLSWSPDELRLLFSRLDDDGWNLVLREPSGELRALTTDGKVNYSGHFADADTIVFMRATMGVGEWSGARPGTPAAGLPERMQVFRLSRHGGVIEQLTNAPFGLFDVAPAGDRVLFLNRVDIGWSVDAVTPGAAPRQAAAAGPLFAQVESGEQPPPAADAPPAEATDAAPAPEVLAEPPPDFSNAFGAQEVPEQSAPPAITVESDEKYSPFDHLFVPQLRAPGLSAYSLQNGDIVWSISAALSGRDRLSLNAWAIDFTYNYPTLENSLTLQYGNQQLAPWSIGAYGSRTALTDETLWSGSVGVGRSVFTVPLDFGFSALVDQRTGQRDVRFIGPSASVSWGAAESTPWGGTQRMVAFGLAGALYPRTFGSSYDMGDLSASVDVAVPLPISRRHSLVGSLYGRVLPGAPDDAMRVGGVPRGFSLYTDRDPTSPPDRSFTYSLPSSPALTVRGFEDFPVRASAAATGHARYRYSFIIDRGFASVLYLLPSFMFRQIDLEAWGAAATTNNRANEVLRAAGAAVVVRSTMGGLLPISLYYQFAWRFDGPGGAMNSFGVSFD